MENEEVWLEIRKGGDFEAMAAELSLSPVVIRLLVNRGLKNTEEMRLFLEGNEQHDPALLKDGEKAAELLFKKIGEGRRIRIIGDYDIDGINASYILYRGLKRAGGRADIRIPDRIRDGYGMNLSMVEEAKAEGIDTILTCDNGISALAEIRRAKELGLTVILTDHHDIPFEDTPEGRTYILPEADAVVNPKQTDCAYPFKGLCGAAIAMKVIQLLYRRAAIPEEEALVFLENAGFATVGDVMDLCGENRTLVVKGLKQLEATKNPGLSALIRNTDLAGKELSAYHVGFVLGPCLNAAGRLDSANRALDLLLSETYEEADKSALLLTELNAKRKAMTEEGVEEAERLIEEEELSASKVWVIYLPDCHESLAGIVAGRIREKYHRPVFVLTRGKEGIKGSGRSIEEYSMFEELTKVKDLLTRFGGHPMAAGLSLEEKNLEELKRRLNENAALTPEDLKKKLRFDMVLPLSKVTLSLAEEINRLEPFGKGNPSPLFAVRDVRVLSHAVIGKNRNVVRCVVEGQGARLTGLWFHDPEPFLAAVLRGTPLSFVYYPKINEYNGERSVQLVIEAVR